MDIVQEKSFDSVLLRVTFVLILWLFWAGSQAREVIHITAPENAPIQQISAQVIKEAYNKLGIDIEIQKLPNARSMLSANSGKYDGELSRIGELGSQYSNLVAVPTAVNMIKIVALGNVNEKPISNMSELESGVVCVRGIKLVEKLIELHGVECTWLVSPDQALNMISLNRAKYTLLPEINAKYTLSKLSLPNVEIVSPVLHSESLFHYLHQKHDDLVEPLNNILQEMQVSGRIEEIYAIWLERLLQAGQGG